MIVRGYVCGQPVQMPVQRWGATSPPGHHGLRAAGPPARGRHCLLSGHNRGDVPAAGPHLRVTAPLSDTPLLSADPQAPAEHSGRAAGQQRGPSAPAASGEAPRCSGTGLGSSPGGSEVQGTFPGVTGPQGPRGPRGRPTTSCSYFSSSASRI